MNENVEMKSIKDFLRENGIRYQDIKGETNIQKILVNGKKIYISFNNLPKSDFCNAIIDGIDYCLVGNNCKQASNPCFYWGCMGDWIELYKKYEDEDEWKKVIDDPIKYRDHFRNSNDTLACSTYLVDARTLKEQESGTNIKNNILIGLWRNGNATEELIKHIRRDLGMDDFSTKLFELLKVGCTQIICHGAPGTGKTYTIENLVNNVNKNKGDNGLGFEFGELDGGVKTFVQFHPSYDYTDFVEGLRPVKLKNGNTSFERMDGIFKRFCREVLRKNDNEKKYLFIIDEINRADLSKVFGELMYCFEDSKRGERIATQYANVPCYEMEEDGSYAKTIENDEFGEGFFIPENVIVIGTMNDIDRSVDSFDFALQRRFQWIEVRADIEMTSDVLKSMFMNDIFSTGYKFKNPALNKYKDKIEEVKSIISELAETILYNAESLNRIIYNPDDSNSIKQLGPDYMIGHAYYKKFAHYYLTYCNDTDSLDDNAFKNALNDIWSYSLESIIVSYIRGNKNLKKKTFQDAFLNYIS